MLFCMATMVGGAGRSFDSCGGPTLGPWVVGISCMAVFEIYLWTYLQFLALIMSYCIVFIFFALVDFGLLCRSIFHMRRTVLCD